MNQRMLLEAKSIIKNFGGVTALNKASFNLQAGEVHVLLGSNGCGKSTLCKVISGVVRPDSGKIYLEDEWMGAITPQKSRHKGIGVVYQELSLVPDLTVAQNILLGMEPVKKFGIIDFQKNTQMLEEITSRFTSLFPENFSFEQYVHRLGPDLRQLTEIMKVLARDPKIIIFDEPTASLSLNQVELFFQLIDNLRNQGKGIIFISHKMEEIFKIGDRITVMRSGQCVGSRNVDQTDKKEIVDLMVGESFHTEYNKNTDKAIGSISLSATGLKGKNLNGIDFSLNKGEIIGLGGLQGQGQREFLLSLFGVQALESGSLRVGHQDVVISSPSKAMKLSIAYISGDRKKHGIFSLRSILENLFLAKINLSRMAFFNKSNLTNRVKPVIDELSLVYDTLDKPINSLSGGNQQKIIIGRWLLNNPDIVLMDDPTRGVDVKTKKELYELIGKMCSKGCSVIWNSSDDHELLQNADRVLVFRTGKVVKELSGTELNMETLYRVALNVDS